MTNPPFILHQLDAVAAALCHPCVYSCIHLPVQSGSDAVLRSMRREYTVAEFATVVDTLRARVPGLGVHTDIICGFPGETDADFDATLALVDKYRFPVVNISMFYPRPGTPAARMPKLPSQTVKARSRALTALHESYAPHAGLVGTEVRAWFTETAADGTHLAGRSKAGVQVLAMPQPGLLGGSATVRVLSAGRWSVTGVVVQLHTRGGECVPAQQQRNAVAAQQQQADSSCGSGADCCGGVDCGGGGAGAGMSCASSACADAPGDACCSSSVASCAPSSPAAPLARRPRVSAASPFAPSRAQQHGGEWVEVALWTGVAVGLSGVLGAGLLHLWHERGQ
jgi:threonylcarbamoyladenosine tRNA methylthiotransferase CDKAL1